jgi:very-short-patch-repair endonuclease
MVYMRKNFQFLLHLETEQYLFRFAQKLRKRSTEAEKLLWDQLKGRKCQRLKFRRQHPIHFYIADFYCHEERLIIEVDGEIHNLIRQNEHDKNRTSELVRREIRILRFTNKEVIFSIEKVLQKIR